MAVVYARNLSTDISTYIQTVYEDSMFVLRENVLAVSLVKVFNDRTGLAVRTGKDYGTAEMFTVGEDDDLVSQQFKPSDGQSLTPAEAAAQFFINDSRVESDPEGVMSDAAMELGMATADKIDVDVFSNFSSLTGGTVGASGTTYTWGHFFAMQSRLRAQKVPRPWYHVLHPYQYHQLGKAASIGATVTNAPGLQDLFARGFYVQTVAGVDIFISTNVPTSSTDAYCAMFHPMAIGYDNRRSPRLEPERDASRRGTELNQSTIYGHGVWKPTYGIQGIFDNTAPTS